MGACKLCPLSNKAIDRNTVPGFGNPDASLAIILDAPNSRVEQLLSWLLVSMSLKGTDAFVDYIFRCPIPKIGNPISKKADRLPAMKRCLDAWRSKGFDAQQIVTLGDIPFEAFSDISKAGKHQGQYHKEWGIWVGYSLGFALFSPGESMRLWRLIYRAAESAGLKPVWDDTVPRFDFPKR